MADLSTFYPDRPKAVSPTNGELARARIAEQTLALEQPSLDDIVAVLERHWPSASPLVGEG